jgi:hypothetical protein
MSTSIKTLDVKTLEWFDKVNGNSYFAGHVIVNYGMSDERKYKMPFQYGYGEQNRYEAVNVLNENEGTKYAIHELRDAGIICRFSKQSAKKSELKNI